MPVISVIVPVYNVEQYLHRCVDSILNQTFTDFELILVDDGSPDNCGAICDEYAEKDNRITVIHQKNGGLSAARNAGIDWSFANSDSQWLTFIDSDDWVHPQYLEILYNAVCDNNAKVSCCAFESVKEETPFENIAVPNIEIVDTKKFYLENNVNFTVAWGKLYHKSCFSNLRYPVGKIHEDEFTTYKILFEFEDIIFIDEKIYCYFQNPNGIMSSQFSIKRYDVIEALEERNDYFKDREWGNLYETSIQSTYFFINLYSIKARAFEIYSQVPKKYRINFISALRYLYNYMGRDKYEYEISKYYPYTILVQSYYLKFKTFFSNRKE